MLFTIISIVLSLVEFIFSRKFIKSNSLLVIRFSINARNIARMKHRDFRSKIIFKRIKLVHCVAKMLNTSNEFVERLIPLQTKKGAMFTIVVQCRSHTFDDTMSLMDAAMQDGSLGKVCISYIYYNVYPLSEFIQLVCIGTFWICVAIDCALIGNCSRLQITATKHPNFDRYFIIHKNGHFT